MALKSVVTDRFFESMMHALDALQLEKGELSFAMLSTSPYDPSRWKLTVASEWIDAMSPLRATAIVREFIRPRLSYKAEKFDGVLIRDTQDRLVRSFTSTIDIPELGTAYQVTGPELEVFHLDEAVCLLARLTVPHLQARSA